MLGTRNIDIQLRTEGGSGVQTVYFFPRVSGGDGELLLEKVYVATTNSSGAAVKALPVKSSGSIRWLCKVPANNSGLSEFYFDLVAGAGSISLDELYNAGRTEAPQPVYAYVDEKIAEHEAAADPHPQYSGGIGVSDHGNLSGLGDDDHSQYFNQLRGDARYAQTNDPRLSDPRTPTGGAGGVLSGNYPNPGFATDMAEQAELDAAVTALGDAIALRSPINSPTFTGIPNAPTPTFGTNTTQIATTAFVRAEIAALVNSAPGTLDQLNELAAALGDNPNFATDTAAALGSKLSKASNLGDLPDAATARTNLGLGNVANLDTSTTANISDSANKRFVTDAEKSVIGNTSGTNTGDQDLSAYATKTGAETLANKTLTSLTINLGSDAAGDIYFRHSSGVLIRLPIGSDGQVLTATSGIPSWATPSSGGGGSLAVGSAIGSGTAGRILFEDASNNLAESVNIRYDETTAATYLKRLDINSIYYEPFLCQIHGADDSSSKYSLVISNSSDLQTAFFRNDRTTYLKQLAVNSLPVTNYQTRLTGQGTTAATYALVVEDGALNTIFSIRDDGNIGFAGNSKIALSNSPFPATKLRIQGENDLSDKYGIYIEDSGLNLSFYVRNDRNTYSRWLGVNNMTPQARLHVTSATENQLQLDYDVDNSLIIGVTNAGNAVFTSAGTAAGIQFNTTRIGFYNAAPIVRPTTAVAAAAFVANSSGIADDTATYDGYTIGQIVKSLRNLGVLT